MKPAVIWLEGIIGVGKTTLARHLAQKFGWRPIEEIVDSNPYLEKFYADPARWTFAMQVHLLHVRHAQHQLAGWESQLGKTCVLDRGLPGDSVFARMLWESGKMNQLEWETYRLARDVMLRSLQPPSVMLYLDVPVDVAMARIKERGRGAEQAIEEDYMRELKRGYESMVSEMEGNAHPWCQGVEVIRLPWSKPDVAAAERAIEEALS